MLVKICVLVMALMNTVPAQGSDTITVLEFFPQMKKWGMIHFEPDVFKEQLGLKNEFLENEHFRLVEGTGENVLTTSDLDARNALYHLHKARSYFAQFDPLNPNLHRKITVRVRMKNKYLVSQHFSSQLEFNNSGYYFADYRGRWGAEIWFNSPRKKIHWKGILASGGIITVTALFFPLKLVSAPVFFPKIVQKAKDNGMDLVKIPAAIYHEAFHWLTDSPYPFDKTTDGHPLKEDFANYFSVVLSGWPRYGDRSPYVDRDRVRDFSKVKDVSSKPLTYQFTNFIPALLLKLRAKSHHPEQFDQSIWNLLFTIHSKTKPSELARSIATLILDPTLFSKEDEASLKKYVLDRKDNFSRLDEAFKSYYER